MSLYESFDEDYDFVETETIPNVNIFYVRHGYSCANAFQYQKGIDNPSKQIVGLNQTQWYKMIDPILSFKGYKQSLLMRDELYKVIKNYNDENVILISSSLLRAIETALLMFPKKKIYILDYLKEEIKIMGKNISIKESTSLPRDLQIKILEKFHGDEVKRLDYTYLPRNVHSGDLKEFEKHILDLLHKMNLDKFKTINLIVVTHSLLLKERFKIDKKPLNNSIIKAKYTINGNKIELIDTKTKKIYQGYKIEDNNTVCDVQRCQIHDSILKKETKEERLIRNIGKCEHIPCTLNYQEWTSILPKNERQCKNAPDYIKGLVSEENPNKCSNLCPPKQLHCYTTKTTADGWFRGWTPPKPKMDNNHYEIINDIPKKISKARLFQIEKNKLV